MTYKMDGIQKNVVYLLIVLLVLFGLFSMFKPSAPAPAPKPARESAVEEEVAKEDPEDEFRFGRRKHDVDPSQFANFSEKQQYYNAMHYREVKERQQQETDARRSARQTRQLSPGLEKLKHGIGLLKDGQVDGAIREIRTAMADEKTDKAVQATGFRYLAQAYQKKEDVPHYCLYMYKYLDLAEKLADNEEARAAIRDQKGKFRDVVGKMREKGHLE